MNYYRILLVFAGFKNFADFQNQFSINPLSVFHPNEITILYIDEENYCEGINILDFESLGYSLALDKYGNTIWFSDKNNFNNSKIISGELLDNGNYILYTFGNGSNQGQPTLREVTSDHEVVWNYQGIGIGCGQLFIITKNTKAFSSPY